ncbi:MAG: transporter [Paucimonas sp.]|nr:transporter [Paucimonas sp.]
MSRTPDYLSGSLGIRVFLSFAGGYLLSYAFRSINAVIAPALLSDLNLSNADLGLLSSAYFVTFACLQLPVGIWLDKYGARRTEACLLLFAAAGAIVFATSTSLAGLWIGRSLIGIGVSGCLMAPLTAFRQWYAPGSQPQLASWMLFSGTAGALSATVPVTLAMPYVGWRGVFWIMGCLIVLVAVAIFFVLREPERRLPLPARHAQPGVRAPGYGAIFGDKYFQRLALLGSVCQGNFVALQTLWIGPWLNTVQGLGPGQAAEVLFVFNLALMGGYVALSWWAPRLVAQPGRRGGWPVTKVLTVGMSCTLLTQVAILGVDGSYAWLLWIVLAAFAPVITLAQTQVSMTFPTTLVGRANSAYNMTVFVLAFIFQWGMGMAIDRFKLAGLDGVSAMRVALGLCIVVQLAALIAFAMHRSRAQQAAVS